MTERPDTATARAEANAARQQLRVTLGVMRRRLALQALAQDAVAELRGRTTALVQSTARTARRNRHPLIAGGMLILGMIVGGRIFARARSATRPTRRPSTHSPPTPPPASPHGRTTQ
ncbi:MAG: hypothetical protein C0476_09080 [Sphingomonas sp.]|nr:hypothetical protein [Sphingomonas sp.]